MDEIDEQQTVQEKRDIRKGYRQLQSKLEGTYSHSHSIKSYQVS
jgi:hypothetical protein